MAFEIVSREQELASLPDVHRRGRAGAGGARARGRARASASRRSGSPGSSRRAGGASASSRRGRPRPSAASRTSGSAICSRTWSTRCCRALLAAETARARGRAAASRTAASRSTHGRSRIAVRDALQLLAEQRAAAARHRRRAVARRLFRAARWRSRCAGSRRPVLVCSPAAVGRRAQPSELERALRRRARRGRSRRAAQRRRAPPAAARPARTGVRAPDAAPHPRASGGNPFFALELARALGATSTPRSRCRVPETLEELVRARLAGLPRTTRDALALASALGTTSRGAARGGRASTADALGPGGRRARDRARRRHRPLHAIRCSRRSSTRTSGDERRSVHARIAQRRRRPARSAPVISRSRRSAPDAGVAAALDEAARLAADRGASAVAAELAEQALRLTPANAGDERRRRALRPQRAPSRRRRVAARARRSRRDLLAETETGSSRAEALVLLAELESQVDSRWPCSRRLSQEAARGPALQVDHPLPPRVGDALQKGRRARPRPGGARARRGARRRRARVAGPRRCRRSSAGSPATRRRRSIPALRTTSRPPSAASSSCRRRRWPS